MTVPSDMVAELKQRFTACLRGGGRDLDLSALLLSDLPKPVTSNAKLAGIVRLDFSHNRMAAFPELRTLPNVSILHAGGNQIGDVCTASFCALTKLRELTLMGNRIPRLPPQIGDFDKLQKLDVSNNALTSVPNEIGYLYRLEDLNLSGNKGLRQLPRTVRDLDSLEMLNVDFCALTGLPSEITYCSSLIELSLGTNQLSSLPSDMGRMTRLARLNLSDNQLTDLPLSMGLCASLGQFGAGCAIDGNPMRDEAMLKAHRVGPDHLMYYLQKRMEIAHGMRGPTLPSVPYHNLLQKRDRKQRQGGGGATLTSLNLGGGAVSDASAAAARAAEHDKRDDKSSKVGVLRKWANEQINMVFVPKLRKMRRAIDELASVQQAAATGALIGSMRPHLEALSAIIPYQEPLSPVRVAAGAPPLAAAKAQMDHGCRQALRVVEGTEIYINSAAMPDAIVAVVRVLKQMKATLDASGV